MIMARTISDSYIALLVVTDAETCTIDVPLVAPTRVERATGTLRSPEAVAHLPEGLMAVLRAVSDTLDAGAVVAIMVHTYTGSSTAIGPFADRATANFWWRQSYNRLARDSQMLFRLVALDSTAST